MMKLTACRLCASLHCCLGGYYFDDRTARSLDAFLVHSGVEPITPCSPSRRFWVDKLFADKYGIALLPEYATLRGAEIITRTRQKLMLYPIEWTSAARQRPVGLVTGLQIFGGLAQHLTALIDAAGLDSPTDVWIPRWLVTDGVVSLDPAKPQVTSTLNNMNLIHSSAVQASECFPYVPSTVEDCQCFVVRQLDLNGNMVGKATAVQLVSIALQHGFSSRVWKLIPVAASDHTNLMNGVTHEHQEQFPAGLKVFAYGPRPLETAVGDESMAASRTECYCWNSEQLTDGASCSVAAESRYRVQLHEKLKRHPVVQPELDAVAQ